MHFERIKRKIIIFLRNKHYAKIHFFAAFLAIVLFFAWHELGHKDIVSKDKEKTVVIQAAKISDVEVFVDALGTVTPEYSVTVKSQISGQLFKVLFKEGQRVKAGDILAEIDARPYQASLTQYEGQLARDLALLKNAKLDLERYQILWQQNSISKQILDSQTSLVNQYEGTVKLDQGLVDNARVNLSYCTITAPIDGQVGLRLVDEGNIIQTSNNTTIAVINTLNPINVIFSIPENDLQDLQKNFHKNNYLQAKAYSHNESILLSTGKVLAIDNQIDPTTGTIKLRAEFQNNDKILFPNQFVNIKILSKILSKVVVVPVSAIQYSQQGAFVYKIEDNKAKIVHIETGVAADNNIVVNSGLGDGDIVVVEGSDKLSDGVSVKISSAHEHI